MWLPLIVVSFAQEPAPPKPLNGELATVRVGANVPRRLGADHQIDQVARIVRGRGIGNLMSDPCIGRAGDAISCTNLVDLIAIAEQSPALRGPRKSRRP